MSSDNILACRDLHPGNILVRRTDGGELSTKVAAETVRGQLQLILLDFGLAEELTPTVRHHFISFLHMIAAGNSLHGYSPKPLMVSVITALPQFRKRSLCRALIHTSLQMLPDVLFCNVGHRA